MTDLHRSATVSHELIQLATRLLMAERPDLIVLGGDYVTWGGDHAAKGDRHFVEPAADAVSALSAPHGVFGVLGNHDDDRDMPAAMAAKGVEILKDARTRLTIRGQPLDLIGIRYWTTRARDIAALARGSAPASILLAHNPSRLKEAAALSLAAHAERPHPRRADCASRPRRHRRHGTSRSSRARVCARHGGLCQPRRRDGLRPYSRQLPARSRGPDAQTSRKRPSFDSDAQPLTSS